MTNSPYIVFTNFSQGGYIWYIRIAVNANGIISYDSPGGIYLGSLESRIAPAVFKFNDSPYIVWIEPEAELGGDGGYIIIAPITISANGAISLDNSRRFVLPETGILDRSAYAVFEFNNTHYIVWDRW